MFPQVAGACESSAVILRARWHADVRVAAPGRLRLASATHARMPARTPRPTRYGRQRFGGRPARARPPADPVSTAPPPSDRFATEVQVILSGCFQSDACQADACGFLKPALAAELEGLRRAAWQAGVNLHWRLVAL